MLSRWLDNLLESCDLRVVGGSACAMVWALLLAISPVLSTESTMVGDGLAWRTVIIMSALIALAAMVAFGYRLQKLARRPSPLIVLVVASAVLSPLGAILHDFSDSFPITVISGACVGFGLVTLVLGWVKPFASVSLRRRVVSTVAAVFLSIFIYVLLVIIPRPLAWIVALALATASTLSIAALFLLVLMTWSMSNPAQYAHETVEMGGVPIGENAGCVAAESPSSGSVESENHLAASIERAAQIYGLSPREKEVVALLSHGRSIPYICDELFIAKSTAQTHVRHIYEKMKITQGRQELIDRIENIPLTYRE